MSNTDYLKQFKAHVKLIDTYGGGAVHHPKMEIGILKGKGTNVEVVQDAQKQVAIKEEKQCYLVCLFIGIYDKAHYKDISISLYKNLNTPTQSIISWI